MERTHPQEIKGQAKEPVGILLFGNTGAGKSTLVNNMLYLTETKAPLPKDYKLELSHALGVSCEQPTELGEPQSDEPVFVRTLRLGLTDAKGRVHIDYLTTEKGSTYDVKGDQEAVFGAYRQMLQQKRLSKTRSFLLPSAEKADSMPMTSFSTKVRHGLVVHAAAKYMDEASLKARLFRWVQHEKGSIQLSTDEEGDAARAWTILTSGQDIKAVKQPGDIVLTENVCNLLGCVKIVTGRGEDSRQDRMFVRDWLINLAKDQLSPYLLDFVDVYFNSSLLAAGLFFVDTPGTSAEWRNSYTVTRAAMQEPHVIMLVTHLPVLKKAELDMLRSSSFLKDKLLPKEGAQRCGFIVVSVLHDYSERYAVDGLASPWLLQLVKGAASKMDPATIMPSYMELFDISPDVEGDVLEPPHKKRRIAGSPAPMTTMKVQQKAHATVAFVALNISLFLATQLKFTDCVQENKQDATNVPQLFDLLKSFAC